MFSTARPVNQAKMVSAVAPKARAVRPSVSAHFQVTFITPSGEKIVEIKDDELIADTANDAGVEIPLSCSAGSCSTCAGILKSGTVDQDDQSFLDEEQMEAGFVLTCVAFPTSDCVIETHKEEDLY